MKYLFIFIFIYSCTTTNEKKTFLWLEKDNLKKEEWLRKKNEEYLNYKSKYTDIIKSINYNKEPKLNTFYLKQRIGDYIFYINEKGIYYREKSKKKFILFNSVKNLNFIPEFITTNFSKYLIIKGSKLSNDKCTVQIWDINDKKLISEFSTNNYPTVQATSNNLYFSSSDKNGNIIINRFGFINKKTTIVNFKSVYSYRVIDKSKILTNNNSTFYLNDDKKKIISSKKLFTKKVEFIDYNGDSFFFFKNEEEKTTFYKFNKEHNKLKKIHVINKKMTLTKCILNDNNLYFSFIENGQNNVSQINISNFKEKCFFSNELATIQIDKSLNDLIITYSSFQIPKRYYSIKKNILSILLENKNDKLNNYKTKQKWVHYKNDSIPIILYYKDSIKKNSPLILYGYGGFKRTIMPDYSKFINFFIEHRGVYVIAGIRGGGEMGLNWHNMAIKNRKKQSFYDYNACLDYIIEKKISSPKKIAIMGSSNGGLLVNYSILEYSKKFNVAISMKGLSDMVNYNKYDFGKYWINEYGNPSKKDMKKYLKGYSPLHNLRTIDNQNLSVLFVTGNKDDRVSPIHTYKFTYGLQMTNNNDIYLNMIENVGHRLPKNRYSKLYSEIYAFIFYNLKIPIKSS